MKSVISLILVTSLALFGKPAYAADREAEADEAPRMDPSKHIRIVYNKFNTPDSKVFEILMGRIQSFDETSYFGEELEDWVYHEMNRTYSCEIETWFMPRVESRRQSRADLRAWISRWKQGFGGTRYNIRTMWAGRESMLDANFVAMCEAAGGIE